MEKENPIPKPSAMAERLKHFIDNEDISIYNLSKKLNIKKGRLEKYCKGASQSISTDVLAKIALQFEDINLNWLLTGRGRMRQNATGHLPAIITVDAQGDETIPLVNSKAAAAYPEQYHEPGYMGELQSLYLPGNRLRNGTYRAFEISGESMAPTFKSADIVVAQFVESPINWRKDAVYVLVFKSGVVLKRVRPDSEGQQLTLLSDNAKFSSLYVDANDLLEAWEVVASVKFGTDQAGTDEQMLVDILQITDEIRRRLERLNLPPQKPQTGA